MIEISKVVPETWAPPVVVVVGMGTGPDDLGPEAVRWIERAEVLAGGERHLNGFQDHPAEKLPLGSPLAESIRAIDEAGKDRRVVVLASGDPLFFGIGRKLAAELGRERIVSIPGLTSVQTLFSRLGEPWEDVRALSLHGRGGTGTEWLDEVRGGRSVALFTDPVRTPAWIAAWLTEAGLGNVTLAVGEDLGTPEERVRMFTPEEAVGVEFSPLNITAVFPPKSDPKPGGSVLGLPEEAFQHRAGLITKMEVRAVALALLGLEPGLTLWDLGAGSGSVSIEAARMVRLHRVFAVERNAERFQDLRENIRRFGCTEIQAVHGNAGKALNYFPDPDRVFIGGSGDDLPVILDAAAKRLRPEGRIVLTAVTLETLERARRFFGGVPFDTTITQLQAARSAPIGQSIRLEALNPVFIITARKKGDPRP